MEMEQKRTSSLLSELKSHPDKSLADHLNNVGNRCKEILRIKNLNIAEFVDFDTLLEISYLIGITHDIGKATTYFQRYITETDEVARKKQKNKPETHHAFISSIFTYYVVKRHLAKKGLLEKEYYKYLPIIGFFVVKRHHGNLDNADDEIYSIDEEKQEVLQKQVKAIDFDELDEIYATFCSDYSICAARFKDDCNVIIEEIRTKAKRLIRRLKDESTLFYFFILLMLYSSLLDADKTDAANLEISERRDIPSDIVDRYKDAKFGRTEETSNSKSEINRIRDEIYNEVISTVEDLNLDKDKILSLNVPTGTGKTLTALSFGLKLRERLKKERGFYPRIIYSLPFLSIIDQNSDVFMDVLDHPTTDILLKHHHLSDVVYTREDEFENIESKIDISKSLLLIEGWNSEIVVTTFIQFFHSFISNRNRMIRKFHNIINSIVILDEVQAIPHEYWLLLKESINFFAEQFNTYFIFVTATQPLIFAETKHEIKSLVENKKGYFKALDRIVLLPHLMPVNINEFKEILQDDILKNANNDFLIVMNTIKSSKKIYNFIKEVVGRDTENTKIYYLSTNIVPKERLKRIKAIKEETRERKIIVSTQLIEAGVDIDVDIVYRDFAPLDSINQVAGRCNRNFGENKGVVKIFALSEKYYNIYDGFITSKTQDVLNEYEGDSIAEPKFLDLNNAYFEGVKKGQSDDNAKEILTDVKRLNFAELSKFKLIKEEHYKADVFAESDDEAEEVWEKYQAIITNKELKGFEKRKEFLRIKKRFYDYVISVDKKKAEKTMITPYLGYVGREDIPQYYDTETGYITNSDDGAWII
jgi:CRISPR-associated endonuclease/helicase Cas3